MKNEYAHFNPTKYGLDVKIATVRTGSHCKFNINYHIIWIPKYRRKVLTGKVVSVLKAPKESRLKAICKYQWRLDKIREWTKSTGRELYIDISLAEIEAHFKEKHKEVAGCNAELPHGIPPTNKLVGILPKII